MSLADEIEKGNIYYGYYQRDDGSHTAGWIVDAEIVDEDNNITIRPMALSKIPDNEAKVLSEYLDQYIVPQDENAEKISINIKFMDSVQGKFVFPYDKEASKSIVREVAENPEYQQAVALVGTQTQFPFTPEGQVAAETFLQERQTLEPDKQFEIDSTSSGWVVKEVSGTPKEEARMLNPDEMAQRNLPPGTQWTISTSGNLEQYFPPEEDVLTPEQLADQYILSGDLDKARDIYATIRSVKEEQLTPERAAEMLVNVAYNPADFKHMMDTMLGRDSKLDPMTSDIRSLQEQAAAMLAGATQPVPVMAPMPPPDLIPARMPETALELEGRVTQEGPLGGPLFMPSEAQEGLEEFEPPPSPPIATFQRTPGQPTLIPSAESPMEEVTRVIPRGGLTEEEFAQLFTRADHPGSTRIPYAGGTPERRAALAPYIGAEYADLYDIVSRQQEAAEHQKKVRKGIRRVGYA